jgi:hypothetical protein
MCRSPNPLSDSLGNKTLTVVGIVSLNEVNGVSRDLNALLPAARIPISSP